MESKKQFCWNLECETWMCDVKKHPMTKLQYVVFFASIVIMPFYWPCVILLKYIKMPKQVIFIKESTPNAPCKCHGAHE